MSPEAHFTPAVVRAAHDVASDVRMIEIVPSGVAVAYPTGSHIDIAVEIAGLPDVRSYSLVGERPLEGAYRIAVKEIANSRGGSRFVRALGPGTRVEISKPKCHFELQYGRREYLLVAAGIGITPIVGMAHGLARHGRPFRLLYAARTRGQMPFLAELSALLADRLEVFVSAEGKRIDLGEQIDRLGDDAEVYLCGPLRMREAAQKVWRECGRQPDRLRFETFASGGRFAPEEFMVRVHDQADREIVVDRDRTMLDALTEAGVELMWDCRRGECGLCQVTVLEVEGVLDHRDVYLSEEEQAEGRLLLSCVSRAVGGGITIDSGFRPAGRPAAAPTSVREEHNG
ncbi:MAG TPA: PDR/VanB family oxidoreductase [Solirubrobacteraceae bacterium]|jgi:vanillate O-demethylase ferredoxin subunit